MSRIGVLAREAVESLRQGKVGAAAGALELIAVLADAEPQPRCAPSADCKERVRLLVSVALGLAAANKEAYWVENMRGCLDLNDLRLFSDAHRLLEGCEALARGEQKLG